MKKELGEAVRELANLYKEGGVKTTRFSLTVSEKENERLERLSGKLNISRQALIMKLLTPALDDLEAEIREQGERE